MTGMHGMLTYTRSPQCLANRSDPPAHCSPFRIFSLSSSRLSLLHRRHSLTKPSHYDGPSVITFKSYRTCDTSYCRCLRSDVHPDPDMGSDGRLHEWPRHAFLPWRHLRGCVRRELER